MWVARVTCATLYVLGNWNATWCVLPCKGQQNSSKTLSSLCWCSSTSLAFSLLTQVTIFFYYLFPGAVPVTHFFYCFFHYLFPGTLQVTFFFTIFLQINYFMVSRGWLKSPFTSINEMELNNYTHQNLIFTRDLAMGQNMLEHLFVFSPYLSMFRLTEVGFISIEEIRIIYLLGYPHLWLL